MRCPTCGGENADGTARCASCGQPFSPTQSPAAAVVVKVSRVAVASAVTAVLSWLCSVPGVIAAMDPYILHPQSDFVELTALANFLGTAIAFVLGVVALSKIACSGGRLTGYGFAAIGASAPAVLILAAMYVPFHAGKMNAPRMRCGTNLAGIGKAMLIYANDYDDKLPLAGGQGTVWGPGLATGVLCSEQTPLDSTRMVPAARRGSVRACTCSFGMATCLRSTLSVQVREVSRSSIRAGTVPAVRSSQTFGISARTRPGIVVMPIINPTAPML